MSKFINFAIKIADLKIAIIQKYIAPLFLLVLRVYIALIFLRSGLSKFDGFDSAIYLFENLYQVPLISPLIAAYLATFFEIFCAVLLIAGFASRIAALPLIGMTLVIQFFVEQNVEHFYWLFLLSTIVIYGAGTLSLDKIFKIFIKKCQIKN